MSKVHVFPPLLFVLKNFIVLDERVAVARKHRGGEGKIKRTVE